MAGVGLQFDLSDIAKVTGQLDKLSADFSNVDPLLDSVGAYLDADVLQRFRQEKAPDGSTWEQSQRAAEDGGLTLTDQRNLATSFTHNVDNGKMEHGSDEVYAAIFQFGGKTGRNQATTIVQREMIGLEQQQLTGISNILHTWGDDIVS
jgi:phage virion morphogenesis protein